MAEKRITIDPDACIGCGLCAQTCHQGAIGMVDGKARLLREDHCDGLGNCLPVCPAGAISFTEREAAPPPDAREADAPPLACGCPGTHARALRAEAKTAAGPDVPAAASHLAQWPVQIKLVPTSAPYFDRADLLVAADCTAFACGDFHEALMRGRVTLIGCPKLDEGDYAQKLTAILQNNAIRSVTVARMEVPCCGGLERAVRAALEAAGKAIPFQVVTLACDGRIVGG